MPKKIIVLLTAAVFILSCQSGTKKKIEEFSKDYSAIQAKYKEKLKTAPRAEVMTIMNQKIGDFEKLLEKYEDSPAVDEIEILRSKVLLNLSKIDLAEKKIDNILMKNSKFSHEAKIVKIQVLFLKRKTDEAYKIFKEIETKMSRGEDLFNFYFYFSLFSDDLRVKEEYAKKILEAADLPEDLAAYKSRIFFSLASIARERMELDKAREYLHKAIDLEKDQATKTSFETELANLDMIGQPAPAITGDTWINSPRLTLEKLKGKVVIIDFWATWCKPCRLVTPVLIEEYNKSKDRGLVVIGLTKLYSSYSDELGSRGEVSKPEEIALIKEFIKRNSITYPTAISYEGQEFEKYKVSAIPTMVFINKAGKIAYIEIGAGSPQSITDKIRKLLEK